MSDLQTTKLTLEERLERLESNLEILCWALARMGTEQDGNWGYKAFRIELADIIKDLQGIQNA